MSAQAPHVKSCAYSLSHLRNHQTTDLQDKHHEQAFRMPTSCGTRAGDSRLPRSTRRPVAIGVPAEPRIQQSWSPAGSLVVQLTNCVGDQSARAVALRGQLVAGGRQDEQAPRCRNQQRLDPDPAPSSPIHQPDDRLPRLSGWSSFQPSMVVASVGASRL
jgi:hypothetical protein